MGRDDAERVSGQRVSWTFFSVLGVRPAIGRDFTAQEDVPDSRVVILSHGLWARRFGRNSSIVGRTIDIEGHAHLVAGVMPADFDNVASPHAQIWRVLGYSAEQPWACRTCRHLRMIARLAGIHFDPGRNQGRAGTVLRAKVKTNRKGREIAE